MSSARAKGGAKGGGALVKLRVSPGARRTGVRGIHGDDAWRVAVSAPPVGGEANAAVERLLAELFGVPRSAAEIVWGSPDRDKTEFVEGVEASAVQRALSGQPG